VKRLFFLIIVLFIIFFNKIIFSDLTFFKPELADNFYPVKIFAAKEMAEGNLPLWNPYAYCGIPFFAGLRPSLYYPPAFVFNVFPFAFSYKSYIFLHYFLSFIFMFLLLKYFNFGFIPSAGGAVLWAFNGFFVARTEILSVFGALIWLPLEFLFLNFMIKRKSFIYVLLLALAFSMQFLAGQIEYVVYSSILCFFYVLYVSVSEKQYKAVKLFLASIIIFLGISAVQLAPSMKFFLLSGRTEYQLYKRAAINFGRIANLLIPFDALKMLRQFHYTGELFVMEYWKSTFYTGLIGAALAVFGFVVSEKKVKYFFISAAAVSIAAALGPRWLYLTGLDNPSGSLFIVIFAVCLGAAAALKRVGKNYLQIVLVTALFFELTYYGRKVTHLCDSSVFKETGPTAEFLMQNSRLERFFSSPLTRRIKGADTAGVLFAAAKHYRDNLFGNTGVGYGLYSFTGGSFRELKYYHNYLLKIDSTPSADLGKKLMQAANIRYILSVKPIKSRNFRLVFKDRLYIYENTGFLPRAYTAANPVFVNKGSDLNYMMTRDYKPGKDAVFEDNLKEKIGNTGFVEGKAEIFSYSAEKVEVDVETEGKTLLILSDTYYPDWKAEIEGVNTEIYRVNHMFRAVIVPPGKHRVIFSYSRSVYIAGLIITLIFAIIILYMLKKQSGREAEYEF